MGVPPGGAHLFYSAPRLPGRRELQLSFAFLLLIGITVVAVAWTLHDIKAEITARLSGSLRAVLTTSRNALTIWTEATRTDVSVLANSESIRKAVQGRLAAASPQAQLASSRQLRSLLAHALQEYGFTDFDVLTSQGRQIRSAGADGPIIGDPATISAALGGKAAVGLPYISPVKGRSASKPTMIAAAPVRDESGRVIAVLAFTIDPARDFSQIMRLGRFGNSVETYAFNSQGLLLTASRFAQILGDPSPSDGTPETRAPRGARSQNGPELNPLTRMVRSAIAGNSGEDLRGYLDYRGVPVIGAWTWDRQLGMGLATEMDLSEAYTSWYIVRRLTLLMLLVIGAAATAMFLILIHHARLSARASAYRQAADAREEALAVVSHELRNPLNTVALGSAILLKAVPVSLDRNAGEVFRTHLQRIRRASALMNQLIQDLLDAAKLQVRAVDLECQECDPGQLIDQSIDLMRPIASEKSIEIRSSVIPGLRAAVADPTRLTQILTNLLSNAIKFSPPAGVIDVEARNAGEKILFRISDNGPGIPSEELPHIFDQYWQAKRTARMGTGLGLFVAKSLVELQGGQIRVTSEVGKGTAFHFTIPACGGYTNIPQQPSRTPDAQKVRAEPSHAG